VNGEFSRCVMKLYKNHWLPIKVPPKDPFSAQFFSIYLRKIASVLHPDTQILQYADDIVFFSSLPDISTTRNSLAVSLKSVYSYLHLRGLDLAPHKSKLITPPPPSFQNISLQGVDIPKTDVVRFLGITLDEKLNGKAQLRSLITKGTKIVLSLSDTWWGAHPSLLLAFYRSVFRSSIEYGAQVFGSACNQSLWMKIQRIQYRIIRTALSLRQSTPICVLLSEACESSLS